MGNSQFTEVAVIAQRARRGRIQNGPRPPCGLPRDGPLNRDLRRLVQSFLRADPTKVVKPERCPTGDVDEEHPIGSMMLCKCLMHNWKNMWVGTLCRFSKFSSSKLIFCWEQKCQVTYNQNAEAKVQSGCFQKCFGKVPAMRCDPDWPSRSLCEFDFFGYINFVWTMLLKIWVISSIVNPQKK